MVTIPKRLRSKASDVSGGRQWLSELPDVCRRLSEEWSLQLGAPFAACHMSLVVTANQATRPVVLKIPMPSTVELGTLAAGARAWEADALWEWAGNGAVQLLERDPATGAMLEERCLPGATLGDLEDPRHADGLAVPLLRRLHVSPPPLRGFDRLADRAMRLAQTLPQRVEDADVRFDHVLLDTAIDLLGQLSQAGPAEVLLHGDFHHENILSAERQPWLVIDPLPMIGDPAYDPVQYLLFRKGDLADPETEWGVVIGQFCRLVDVDAERVKAWMFARLISDAVGACVEGRTLSELESRHGDLWTARLVQRLRA